MLSETAPHKLHRRLAVPNCYRLHHISGQYICIKTPGCIISTIDCTPKGQPGTSTRHREAEYLVLQWKPATSVDLYGTAESGKQPSYSVRHTTDSEQCITKGRVQRHIPNAIMRHFQGTTAILHSIYNHCQDKTAVTICIPHNFQCKTPISISIINNCQRQRTIPI